MQSGPVGLIQDLYVSFSSFWGKVSPSLVYCLPFCTTLNLYGGLLLVFLKLKKCGPLMLGHPKRKMSIWQINSTFICCEWAHLAYSSQMMTNVLLLSFQNCRKWLYLHSSIVSIMCTCMCVLFCERGCLMIG